MAKTIPKPAPINRLVGAEDGFAAARTVLGGGFVLVRDRSAAQRRNPVRAGETAVDLVSRAAQALKKPGIDQSRVVFGKGQATRKKVFSYSADPADPSLLVREDSDGTRTRGRFGADGKFRQVGKRS
jgi:hypothetical protein